MFLDFNEYNPNLHNFFFDSPYNTEIHKFRPETKFRTNRDKRQANIRVVSSEIDENILPEQYANIVYDMYGSFLILLFKKIKKDALDDLKKTLDYDLINSFLYPASFNEQKYAGDDSIVNEINIRDFYLKCWNI